MIGLTRNLKAQIESLEWARTQLFPLIEKIVDRMLAYELSNEKLVEALENTQKLSSQDACKPDFWDFNETALTDHAARMEKLRE